MLGVDFKKVHCLSFRESKRDVLKLYKPTVWVEDKLDHALAGVDLKHCAFLINRPHNLKSVDETKEVIRVNSWFDIYDLLLEAGIFKPKKK